MGEAEEGGERAIVTVRARGVERSGTEGQHSNEPCFFIEADKDTGGTTVIVKFVDKQAAENFVEKIKVSSGGMDGILDVKYFLGTFNSFSFALRPHTFIAAFML